jgi:hypothetical protein
MFRVDGEDGGWRTADGGVLNCTQLHEYTQKGFAERYAAKQRAEAPRREVQIFKLL